MTARDENPLADALFATLVSGAERDDLGDACNVVDGLFAIARALEYLARAVERLGVNDADTRMGALELVAREIHEGFEALGAQIADR